MSTGKIKTLYSDKEKTEALFPRTKTSAISDAEGRGLDAILENVVTNTDIIPISQGGTGASERENAYLNVVGGGTYKGDIDALKDGGVYWIQIPNCTGTFPPYATGNYGFLEVCKASQGTVCIQRFYGYLHNIYWSRVYVNSAWQPWRSSHSLTSEQYGTALPTAGNAGRIFFKKVSG